MGAAIDKITDSFRGCVGKCSELKRRLDANGREINKLHQLVEIAARKSAALRKRIDSLVRAMQVDIGDLQVELWKAREEKVLIDDEVKNLRSEIMKLTRENSLILRDIDRMRHRFGRPDSWFPRGPIGTVVEHRENDQLLESFKNELRSQLRALSEDGRMVERVVQEQFLITDILDRIGNRIDRIIARARKNDLTTDSKLGGPELYSMVQETRNRISARYTTLNRVPNPSLVQVLEVKGSVLMPDMIA